MPKEGDNGGYGLRRVKTHITGLDEELEGGLPKGYIILICGTHGTMKSSVAYSILYNNALINKTPAIYITLEQSRKSILEQMLHLGMDYSLVKDKLMIFDIGILRKNFADLKEKGRWMTLFRTYVQKVKRTMGSELVVIDSLDALEATADVTDRRTELFQLFEWLRDLDVTSMILSEITPRIMIDRKCDEGYLADGIILLKLKTKGESEVLRSIQIIKMRTTKHNTGEFALLCESGRFQVTQAISQ
jgi:KaiC/GvpD/RAD55 family RecA-like ATPase